MAAVTPMVYPQQPVAPRVYAARPPPQSNNFLVFLLMGVIALMVVGFFYLNNKNSKNYEKKMREIEERTKKQLAQAKTEEEKREVQRKASYAKDRAKMEKRMKMREEKLKRIKARADSDMKKAVETINEAKRLKLAADKNKADAQTKAKEAQETMKKAIETNDANLKKLAEEKKRVAEEAQKKVEEADKKAAEAIAAAKKEAQAAVELKKRLEAATAKVQGKIDLSQKATVAVGKEEIAVAEKPKGRKMMGFNIKSFRVKLKMQHGKPPKITAQRRGRNCRQYKCQGPAEDFQLVQFNGKKPQHFLVRSANNGRYCTWDSGKYRFGCPLESVSDEEAYSKKAVFTVERAEQKPVSNDNFSDIKNDLFHFRGVKPDGSLVRCTHYHATNYGNQFVCVNDPNNSRGGKFLFTRNNKNGYV